MHPESVLRVRHRLTRACTVATWLAHCWLAQQEGCGLGPQLQQAWVCAFWGVPVFRCSLYNMSKASSHMVISPLIEIQNWISPRGMSDTFDGIKPKFRHDRTKQTQGRGGFCRDNVNVSYEAWTWSDTALVSLLWWPPLYPPPSTASWIYAVGEMDGVAYESQDGSTQPERLLMRNWVISLKSYIRGNFTDFIVMAKNEAPEAIEGSLFCSRTLLSPRVPSVVDGND